MSYPQQQNHPQHQHYPPQNWQRTPPPQGYAPPPPPAPDPRLERGRKLQRFLRIIIVIALGGAAAYFGVYYGFIYNGRPEVGDCLSATTKEFAGWLLVDCSDPTAAYEVVAVQTGGKYDRDLHTCDPYPDGQAFYEGAGRKGRTSWEMCVVPLGSDDATAPK
ncbi:hypothetical protein AB0I28_29285 [Phytomonospora sp. NPDC050363]|uniref:LppU/SCO3897 family protein n=1 Tax=Phytomonospora sp. NPDC050363 TaxID=3155642 RepID=UPI0033D2C4A0